MESMESQIASNTRVRRRSPTPQQRHMDSWFTMVHVGPHNTKKHQGCHYWHFGLHQFGVPGFKKNISFYQWRNSQQLVAQGHDIFACYIISYVISMCSHIMSAENHRVQYLRILMADCHEMFGQLFQLFGLAFCPDLLVP